MTGTEDKKLNIVNYFAVPNATANAISIKIAKQFGTSVEKIEARVEGILILKVFYHQGSSFSSMSHLNILPIEETLAKALSIVEATEESTHSRLFVQLRNTQNEYQFDALRRYLFEGDRGKNG